MMACLRESELRGYLEESGATPLRQMVEGHLVSCARCRGVFDRVVATHQRVNAWRSELQSPAENFPVDAAGALARLSNRIEASRPADRAPVARPDDHLARLLVPAAVEIPWYFSLYQSIHDLIKPEELPPLEITSKPEAVKSIWGLYAKDPRSRYISVAVHAAAFALLVITFTNRAVQRKLTATVNLIDPNLRPYEAPPKPKAAGGGRRRSEIAPLCKGQAPRPSVKQFTPPRIVQEQPKPAMIPTLIAPPDAVLPQNNLPNWGDPLAKLSNLSNGTGLEGGVGSGTGGGLGSGKGGGFGPCEGGGIGGGVFRAGGGVTQPAVIFKVDPEYSEEARKAKYSGTVMLSVIVDSEGHARDIHVVRSLGMGLDEKAIEAVGKWKFRPGMTSGQPDNVRATIEVISGYSNFRLGF